MQPASKQPIGAKSAPTVAAGAAKQLGKPSIAEVIAKEVLEALHARSKAASDLQIRPDSRSIAEGLMLAVKSAVHANEMPTGELHPLQVSFEPVAIELYLALHWEGSPMLK